MSSPTLSNFCIIFPFPRRTKPGINKSLNKSASGFLPQNPKPANGPGPHTPATSSFLAGGLGSHSPFLLGLSYHRLCTALLWLLPSAHGGAGSSERPPSLANGQGLARGSLSAFPVPHWKMHLSCQRGLSRTSAYSSPRVTFLVPKNILHWSWGAALLFFIGSVNSGV